MKINFQDKTWEELKDAIDKNAVILIPIGQVEEHGFHLPVKTDVIIAEKICERVALQVGDKIPVLVTPAIWSGYSTKEVTKWPGCMNLRVETFMSLIYDICFSLVKMGFKKIVLVSTHGNHTGALKVVTRKIADDTGVYMALTLPVVIAEKEVQKVLEKGKEGSCHGGEYETSLMLYLNKNSVKMEKSTDVDVLRLDSNFSVFISTWGLQKSKTGIYGDPTAATEKKGKDIFESIVKKYTAFLKEFYRYP
jgi:creatinine amidohydrolase